MKNFLTEAFNNAQNYFRELKTFKAAYKQLKADVDAGNTAGILSGLEKTKDSRFMDRDKFDDLLQRTLESDNLASFNALMTTQPGPNYYFEHTSSNGTLTIASKQHVLTRAIILNAEKIALNLARNPAIVVDQPGHSHTHHSARYSSVPTEFTEQYPLPVDAAKKKGMTALHAILETKTKIAIARKRIADKKKGNGAGT